MHEKFFDSLIFALEEDIENEYIEDFSMIDDITLANLQAQFTYFTLRRSLEDRIHENT